MNPAEISALRSRACAVIAALGDVLDSLTVLEQTQSLPDQPAADAAVAGQVLDEAALAADTAVTHASDLASALDRLATAHRAADPELPFYLRRS